MLRVDLEAHRDAELRALAEHVLHRGEEVLGVVGELEVGVAGDAERVVLEHLHAGEQRVEVRGDHLLERDEARAAGHRDEAGEQRRHLDPREALLAGARRRARRPRGSATGSRCTGTGARGRRRAA